ncbi:glutamate:proton symporter [Cellvibrio zantedeschiae]|uniref:Glutamate:proton symporter n=1 Tax=Cellvibrio zantedeschiae TaxID=1237077 RepID=A0ABQ3BCY6_9GAMM|nr:dicarboxylate/amino acid:cation symporter [Cellvibrio zantedeschiae]GGY86579.1 glutamate:proton symporter [Cellvibrio zantedeschiae]
MPSLNQQIFIGAFVGLVVGSLLNQFGGAGEIQNGVLYASTLVANFFVDLLKMVLIPLVFTTLVVGVANLQAHKNIHKVWTTTLIFFATSTSLAMLLGLVVMNLFRPGEGMHLAMFHDAMGNFQPLKMTTSEFFVHFLHNIFQNPFSALAKGDVMGVVVFALFLGVALVMGGERYRNILNLFQEFLDVMMRIIGWIMYIAPLGVCALLLKLAATQNVELLATLTKFVVIVTGATLFHGVVVLPLLLFLVTKKSPFWFWRGAREALITAFATSSSNATLPVTLRCTEKNLNVRKDVAGFVVPLGATLNMDGTALYEAAAALFVANLAGIDLNLSQQLVVFFTAMVASIGAPGLPSAGMVTMVLVLQAVGLPVEAIAILLPIDRLLDTVRTAVNVQGDMIGSVIVQNYVDKSEQIR